MRLLPVFLAACLFAATACSRSEAPAASSAAVAKPAVATTPGTDAQEAATPPAIAPNLLSFANGTIMPLPTDALLVTGPILMIVGSSFLVWVGVG